MNLESPTDHKERGCAHPEPVGLTNRVGHFTPSEHFDAIAGLIIAATLRVYEECRKSVKQRVFLA
jgi:hypothetical protein